MGLIVDIYADLWFDKKACCTSQLSGKEYHGASYINYISWLLFVCQPDTLLYLSFEQIMLTSQNASFRLQLVFWDYSTIPKQRPPDAPLDIEIVVSSLPYLRLQLRFEDCVRLSWALSSTCRYAEDLMVRDSELLLY